MVPKKFKKPARKLPRGQKLMVKAAPSSDRVASNALSSHVRPSFSSKAEPRKKRPQIKTHGPLGNVRVDKRAQAQKRTAARVQADASKKKKAVTKKPVELTLNTSLKPAGIVHRRGKKGKVFADDADALSKVLSVVTARMDQVHATKIERAKQLEEVREAKRKEIEKREQEKSDKLENKKREIKQAKRKSKPRDDLRESDDKPKKRSVRFAM